MFQSVRGRIRSVHDSQLIGSNPSWIEIRIHSLFESDLNRKF